MSIGEVDLPSENNKTPTAKPQRSSYEKKRFKKNYIPVIPDRSIPSTNCLCRKQ